MWRDRLFWFTQPGLDLNNYDKYFFWLFVVLAVLGAILKIVTKLASHPIYWKLYNKFANSFLAMGLSGLAWFGMRYEDTPIFADRYLAALTIIIFLVWVGFILKYFFTSFGQEKAAYDRMQLNSKYIPGPKK